MKNNSKIIFALILIFSATGCGFRDFEDYNGFMAMKSGRIQLLNERLSKFHKEIEFGNYSANRILIAPEIRNQFDSKLGIKAPGVKVADIVVEDVNLEMETGAYDATVIVKLQAYRAPSYVVENKYYLETWQFRRFSGGWILTDVEKTDAPNFDENDEDEELES